MIKTVKTKKMKNLSELIAYISVNGIKDANFVSNYENIVSVDHSGQITTVGKFYNDTFTIEVEEEITNDTRFKGVQEIYIDDEGLLQVEYHPILARKSINDVLEEHDEETECLYIYAAVDGKTELIYERNEESINA